MNPYDYIFVGACSVACTWAQALAENATEKTSLLERSCGLIACVTRDCVSITKVLKGVLPGGMAFVQHTIREYERSLSPYSYVS
jgi:hypothetical protein